MDKRLSYGLILLVFASVAVPIGALLKWEYDNQVGAFRAYNHTQVVTFNRIDGDGSRRVLVANRVCIFTVGESYAWVEAGKPYLVSWYDVPANAKVIQTLISITAVP